MAEYREDLFSKLKIGTDALPGHRVEVNKLLPIEVEQPKNPDWELKAKLQEVKKDEDEAKLSFRTFDTGATRDTDAAKLDFEGFLSPTVIQAFGEYMHKNRFMRDGTLRDSDNWQKGIPKNAYIKSAWRHFLDWWMIHRGLPAREDLKSALCAIIFNTMGYLHEILKEEK